MNLVSLLASLDSDPSLIAEMNADPVGFLRRHGATDAEIAVWRTGDFSSLAAWNTPEVVAGLQKLRDSERGKNGAQMLLPWPWPWPFPPGDE